ncbi:NXPE family member 3-like [Haliotis cracherodii]|uniref:NXPE family member 3-like n=1 Tax=Haliotis cracherodii TaxID=6455 RepID=UPI0039E83428
MPSARQGYNKYQLSTLTGIDHQKMREKMSSFPLQRCCSLLVVLMVAVLFFSWNGFVKFQMSPQPYPSIARSQKQSHVMETQIVPESYVLSDAEIDDVNSHASSTTSKMSIINPKFVYKLNGTIRVKIELFDHKNRTKTRGGDMLIVWMRDKSKGAASAGTVIDHDNGTYTGVLRILWTGKAVIRAAMLAPREKMAFVNREFRHGYGGKILICLFNTPGLTETSSGHMESKFVNKIDVCNLTDKHYGVPLYCDKPKKKGVQCSHWTGVNSLGYLAVSARPNSKWYLSSAGPAVLPDIVTVKIPTVQNTTLPATVPCSRSSVRNSWVSKPVGFFYNSTWRPLLCFNDVTVEDYDLCLANRTLRMFGDSTVRQWFSFFYKHLNLTWRVGPWQITKNLQPTGNWYSYSEAYKKDFNYTIFWAPHGLPMTFNNANRTALRPSFVHLDEIPSGSRDIVLIHLYAHFLFYPVHMFRSQIQRIRPAVQRLLERAPDIKIAIKGPHYFVLNSIIYTFGRMWGPVYDKIIREEFVGLYDRVIYLDFWEMLLSVESPDVHPGEKLINTMIRTLFGYVCKK